jgi:hypothetical protein
VDQIRADEFKHCVEQKFDLSLAGRPFMKELR